MNAEEYTEIAIRAAAECLQWQATDISEGGGDGYPVTDGGDEYTDAVAEIPYLVEAVTSFVAGNWETLTSAGVEAGQCGHDYVLTVNGHGAGFWDRGLGDAGDKLTTACKGYLLDAEFQLNGDGDVAFLMVENTVIVDDLGLTS